MNSRFKAFGFGKRKSTASIQGPPSAQDLSGTQQQQPTQQSGLPPPPAQIPQQQPLGHVPSPSASSSAASVSNIPMNHPAQHGNRPPSYTANFHGQPPLGRTSPLAQQQGPARTPPTQMVGGPPPINTGAPHSGYPPQGQVPGGPPPMGGPPGYGGAQAGYPPGPPPQQHSQGQPPPGSFAAQQQYRRAGDPAEVEGNSRSKAQLIVGIDFVSASATRELGRRYVSAEPSS